MKGRFEWWLGCLEGFKAPRSLELVVGNPNYGSPATSFASLAPLCVARLLFQYILATNLPLRWQFHRLHGKLLTGDMSVGMRWLFMAWGGGVLNAWLVGGGLLNAALLIFSTMPVSPQISRISSTICLWSPEYAICRDKVYSILNHPLRDDCNMKMLWNELKPGQQAQTPCVFLVYSWRQGRCARPWSCSDIPRALP